MGRKKIPEENRKRRSKPTSWSTGWSTHDELRFLRKIGTHTAYNKFIPKQELLFRYEKGLNKREKWGNLSEITIRAYLVKAMGR